MKISRISLVLQILWSLVTGLFFAPSAHAWGCKGHQTVALVAEKHLSPAAKAMVQDLLTKFPIPTPSKLGCAEGMGAMADASAWPDVVRRERNNGPWHYVDIPRGAADHAAGVVSAICTPAEGCVVRAIQEQFAVLKNKNADLQLRVEALRYLIHFVGDIHQPLHAITNSDRGGNCVPLQYFNHKPHKQGEGYSPELHGIWDREIVEREMSGREPAEFATDLDNSFSAQFDIWTEGGIQPEEWAWESFDHAEEVAYGQLPRRIRVEPNVPVASCTDDRNIGKRMKDKQLVIGNAYQDAAAPLVDQRLAQAGFRLAFLINEAAK